MHAIGIDENLMLGESVIVPVGLPLSDIPGKFLRLVPELERQVYLSGGAHLEAVAASCKHPPLGEWLKALADASFTQLEIHTSPIQPTAVLLRFSGKNGMEPAIGLSASPPKQRFPAVLKQVYSTVSIIKYSDWEAGGGLYPAASVCRVSESGTWLDEESEEPQVDCRLFCGTSDGDAFGYDNAGDAYWYQHETGGVEKIGSLQNFMAQYFRQLIEGKEPTAFG